MSKRAKILSEISSNLMEIRELNKGIEKKKEQLLKASKEDEREQNEILNNTLSSQEMCAALGISRPTLIKRRELGLIPYIKLGFNFRYFNPITEMEVCNA